MDVSVNVTHESGAVSGSCTAPSKAQHRQGRHSVSCTRATEP